MTTLSSDKENKSQSILRAAWIIAVVIVLSKIMGFIRDVVVAKYYGASMVSDAYFYAYQIPALALTLLGGVGGPFHSATVAVFAKMIPSLKDKPDEKVQKLFNTFLTSSFVVFTVFALLLFLFSEGLMKIIISQGSPELISLASMHLKIMSPILIIGGVLGIYYGILISYNKFILPNLSPLIGSIITIGILLSFAGNDLTGVALAWATTIGSLAMLLMQIPKVREIGFLIKPNFDVFNNYDFKMICELLFPAILSSTVGQINVYVDMFFASSLQEGAWTAITFANRVFQFPVGVLVTAFLVPLFPMFSKLVAKGDFKGVREYFNKGVGVLFFIAIPVVILILTVGYEGIRVLFQRGAFNDTATFMVTQALWFLSFSILPYVFRDSITRVYYSFNDSKTPFLVAFASIVLKFVLNVLLVNKMGIGGITLSTTLVTLFNACALGILIGRRIKLNYGELFFNLAKMLIAGFITLIICLPKNINFLIASVGISSAVLGFWLDLVKIFIAILLVAFIYIGLNLLFRVSYVIELKDRFLNKLIKKC